MEIFAFFCLGLFYGNLLEYVIHRYVFHKWGRKKGSIWSYHLRGHHRLAKKQGFVDLTESPVETVGLIALLIIHAPLWLVSIPMLTGVYLYAIAFSFIHGWMHKHPEISQKWFKWHWESHEKPKWKLRCRCNLVRSLIRDKKKPVMTPVVLILLISSLS